MKFFVSILVPLYNHRQYIKELLDSINSICIKDFEVVIIDDGSTDGSYEELLKIKENYSYSIRTYTQNNAGITFTCNRLADLSSHEFICFIASDDLYLSNRFEFCQKALEKDPGLMVVYENGSYFKDGVIGSNVHEGELEERLMKGDAREVYDYISSRVPGFFIQAMTIRKTFFYSVGKFDEYLIADDWALNLRIFRALIDSPARFYYFKNPVFLYRDHGNNIHKNNKRQYALIDQVVTKIIPTNSVSGFDEVYARYFIIFIIEFELILAYYIARKKNFLFIFKVLKYSCGKIKRILKI
jgi:glycosyltransferase involved in cell wall biosynthesis